MREHLTLISLHILAHRGTQILVHIEPSFLIKCNILLEETRSSHTFALRLRIHLDTAIKALSSLLAGPPVTGPRNQGNITNPLFSPLQIGLAYSAGGPRSHKKIPPHGSLSLGWHHQTIPQNSFLGFDTFGASDCLQA